jgi:hypothetical protein
MMPLPSSASDGYHTFDELYEHRAELYIALCRRLGQSVWCSRLHHDGTSFGSWFIMGIERQLGAQITYHLPAHKWAQTEFAETLERAPEWDGPTPADVLMRLRQL